MPPGIGTAPTSPPNEPPGPTTGVGAARFSVLSRAAAGGGGAAAGGVTIAAGGVLLLLLGRGCREALPGRGWRAGAEVERAGRAAREEDGRLGRGWRAEAGPEAEGSGWREEAGPGEPGRGARGAGGLLAWVWGPVGEDFLPAGFWTEGGPEAAAEEVAGAATTLEGVRSAVGMAMIWTPMPPVGTSGTPGTAAPGGETAAAAPGGPLAAPRACPGEPAGQTVTVTGAAPLEQRSVLPF